MKPFVFVILHIIDFIESIPYNIRWALEFAWWVISLPFCLAKIHVSHYLASKRIDKAFRKDYSSFYSEGE